MITRPLLAAKVHELNAVPLPMWATPKIDGFRCLKINGHAVTRSFKPVANLHVRNLVEQYCPDGFDGELIVNGGNFNSAQSAFTTVFGQPDFSYLVFDYLTSTPNEPYLKRVLNLANHPDISFVSKLIPTEIKTIDELADYENEMLEAGFEGVCLRSENSIYKCGRSTLREKYLIALKRFIDEEATVVGFEERMHNDNPAFTGELGQTKRQTLQENMIPTGMLGALVVRSAKWGEFRIGTGFNDVLRQDIWDHQYAYLGKLVTFRYQPYGTKDKPRILSFKGFRHHSDTGAPV